MSSKKKKNCVMTVIQSHIRVVMNNGIKYKLYTTCTDYLVCVESTGLIR